MGLKEKYIIINFFSLIKRLMVFYPSVYNLIKYVPILIIPNRYISKNGIITSLILSLIIFLNHGLSILFYYAPLFIFLIFKSQFYRLKFQKLILGTRWLLVVAILYGVLQKTIGFLPFEKTWIYSDLSVVNSDNIFIQNRTIRPFSIFAHIPEFSIFCAIYFIYFLNRKNIWWSLIGLIGLLVSGSRGVIIATITALMVVFVFKPNNYRKNIIYTICVSLSFYYALIFGSDFFSSVSDRYSNQRLLLYGTFNGRIENILSKISEFKWYNLVFPIKNNVSEASDLTVDNLHVNLLLTLGLFGFVVFWRSFRFIDNSRLTHLYFALFISFGFFNDLIFSVYSLLLFFVCIYGSKR